MGFGENLKMYRKKAKFSQGELAEKIAEIVGKKVTYENVKSWESGTNPKIQDIYALSEILNIPEQLLFDNSEKALNKISTHVNINSNSKNLSEIQKAEDYNLIVKNDNIDLDLIAVNTYNDVYASAGFGNSLVLNNQPQKQYFERDFLKKFYGVENFKSLDMVRVIGDSMLPIIHDGEYILIEKQTKPKNGNIVIAIINDDLYVKKFIVTDPFTGFCRLESLNNNYPNIEVDTKDKLKLLNILGIVRSKTKVY